MRRLTERGYATVTGPVNMTEPRTVSEIRRMGLESGLVFTDYAIDPDGFRKSQTDPVVSVAVDIPFDPGVPIHCAEGLGEPPRPLLQSAVLREQIHRAASRRVPVRFLLPVQRRRDRSDGLCAICIRRYTAGFVSARDASGGG
jgi:hypothetical protein